MFRIKHSPKTLIRAVFFSGAIALGYPQSTLGQKSGSQAPASSTSSSAPIAGPQNVNVVNTPTVNLAPGTSVSVSGTPSVTVSGTPNVAISGTPTVALAPGATVSVSGTPSVTVAGTPSVTISGTPTVNVNPAGTVLAYDQTVTIQVGDLFSLPQLDVSNFKEIRIFFTSNGGSPNFSLSTRLVNPNNPLEVVVLDELNQSATGTGTRTYDILAQRIDFFVAGIGLVFPPTVHVQVFGRSN